MKSELELILSGQDDFRGIKGISEVAEKALYKLGIQTYQDLARAG
jgi:predicted flap endonuclease-1-like 5' DNA nuclease